MRETAPIVQWRFQTKGRLGLWSPALTAEGTIYLGDHDCQLYALSATGELLWRRKTAERLGDATPAATANGDLLRASETGRLYCFSAAGDLRWSSTRNWLVVTSTAPTTDGLAIFSAGAGPWPSAPSCAGQGLVSLLTPIHTYFCVRCGFFPGPSCAPR